MDYDDYGNEMDFDGDYSDGMDFMDPGGTSALRKGVRNRKCPTCKEPRKLTKKDVELGYQCDTCADKLERGGGY